ncbi:DUF2303 family protein [Amycolatopsis benzoatilytica]|uniref:DUF2303 family protein n=1 Tax=Amycolatopsis benzoatilytica TaxID=346045 RepID=UPI000361B340|nr:DUF2303 family protein [Amycolatopsis benzoatilytica]
MEYDTDTPTGALIADLSRRVEANDAALASYNVVQDGPILARTARQDERLETVNLEKWLPEPTRARGTVTLHDPGDFTIYTERLCNAGTTVFGEEDRARFTAVFNDHQENGGGEDEPVAGWRDHTAVLQLQTDPDWSRFLAVDRKYLSQLDFAEFLSDNASAFVEPDGATLLEVATHFRAHKKAEFHEAVNLDTGDVQLTYNEETATKTTAGQVAVPRELVVRLTPFLGYPPVDVRARLRYSIDGGRLQMGFVLQRPDLVKREAFAQIRNGIADQLTETHDVPVLLGTPPASTVPQS